MSPMRIAIAGASGRMGRMLIEATTRDEAATLVAALDRPDSPAIGEDACAFLGIRSGVLIRGDVEAALAGADFLIDFTRPEATLAHLDACKRLGVKMIIGTTPVNSPYPAALLISRAWNLSGIVAREFEQTSGQESSDGLFLLNELLGYKSVQTDLIPYWGRIEFPLVQGQERYYIPNLLAMETFTFNIGSVRFPTFSAGRRQYFGDGRVDNIQSLPFEWHVERIYNGLYLYLYYLPDSNYIAKITGKFGLQNVELQTNLATIYDNFYTSYLRFSLANYQCLEYDISFPPDKAKQLMKMEHALRWVSPPDLHMKKVSFMNKNAPMNWAHINISSAWNVS